MQAIPKEISFKEIIRLWMLSKLIRYAEYFIYVLPNITKINKIKKFKNTKLNRSAIVLASGPSVRLLDGAKILKLKENGFDIFAGNSYLYSNLGAEVMPDYYFLSDEKFFREPISSQFQKVLENINNSEINTFIPHRYSKFFPERSFIHVFNDTIDHFSKNVIDMRSPRCYPSMTLYKALSMACYMGYEYIYICGFDNNYFKYLRCDEENNIFYEDVHYYTSEISEKTKIKVDKKNHATTAEFLIHISTLFSGLEKFKNFNIINLDSSSLVDTFSKTHKLDIYKEENK